MTGSLAIDDGEVVVLPDQGVKCYPRVVVVDVSATSTAMLAYRGYITFKTAEGQVVPLHEYGLKVGYRVEVAIKKSEMPKSSLACRHLGPGR